jgi:hypothetical protein
MAEGPSVDRLRQLLGELRADLDVITAKVLDARDKLSKLDEALGQPKEAGVAWPANKRQARFYWGVFLAGGAPDGDFVSESQVNAELKKLTLDGKQESVAQMRPSIKSRLDQHYLGKGKAFQLLDAALPIMTKFRADIEGIPADISI